MNERSALDLYASSRPEVITHIIQDPNKNLTDADVATGAMAGGGTALALEAIGAGRAARMRLAFSIANSIANARLWSLNNNTTKQQNPDVSAGKINNA